MSSKGKLASQPVQCDFEAVYGRLMGHIKSSYDVVEVSRKFTPQKSISDLVLYALTLCNEWPDMKESFSVVSNAKDDKVSDQHRALGNPYFGKRVLAEALKEYNTSIRFAKHPIGVCSNSKSNIHGSDIGTHHQLVQGTGHQLVQGTDHQLVQGTDTFQSLSLVYANRSAVLYDLNLFNLALNDINSCICYGYPNKINKIATRKAKCAVHVNLIKFFQNQSAKNSQEDDTNNADILNMKKVLYIEMLDVVDKCLESFRDMVFNEKEHHDLKSFVSKTIDSYAVDSRYCEANSLQKRSNNTADTDPSSSALYQHGIAEYIAAPVPELHSADAAIRGLSSDVALLQQHGRGRYLVAKCDIYPGSILAVDPGHGSAGVVLPYCCATVCCTCLTAAVAPLPCTTCTTVVFCSESCRATALGTFHQYECNLLSTLQALDMGKNSELALRMVTQHGLQKLKYLVAEIAEEQEYHSCNTRSVESSLTDSNGNEGNSRNLVGFSPAGIYDSKDYRSIYHLVGNQDSRSVGDIFKRSIMAAFLVKLLEKGGRFFANRNAVSNNNAIFTDDERSPTPFDFNAAEYNKGFTNDPISSTDESDRILVGCVLLRHIMNFPCNAHSITVYNVDSSCYSESHTGEIGANAFGVLSLTNHSCVPNCHRQSYGGVGVLRAIAFIPMGAEVADSYCAHFAVHSKQERKLMLRRQYCFECECVACRQDWHSFACSCVECQEVYCRDCNPRCSGITCVKSTNCVRFKLKCLKNGCEGVMNTVTDSCDVCERIYRASDGFVATPSNPESDKPSTILRIITKPNNTSASFANPKPNNTSNCGDAVKCGVDCTISVREVVDMVESTISHHDSVVSDAIMAGDVSSGNVSFLEEMVCILTRYVVAPNKTLLKAQEILKHCYDRNGCYVFAAKHL